jgi:methyl coenzyme M reductase system subunit A2
MVPESITLLTIDNVTKRFEGKTVLSNVSATISTGQILGLIGKSAAGKSVLIHMLRGNEEYAPDEGRVLYHLNVCPKCGHLDLPVERAP